MHFLTPLIVTLLLLSYDPPRPQHSSLRQNLKCQHPVFWKTGISLFTLHLRGWIASCSDQCTGHQNVWGSMFGVQSVAEVICLFTLFSLKLVAYVSKLWTNSLLVNNDQWSNLLGTIYQPIRGYFMSRIYGTAHIVRLHLHFILYFFLCFSFFFDFSFVSYVFGLNFISGILFFQYLLWCEILVELFT